MFWFFGGGALSEGVAFSTPQNLLHVPSLLMALASVGILQGVPPFLRVLQDEDYFSMGSLEWKGFG